MITKKLVSEVESVLERKLKSRDDDNFLYLSLLCNFYKSSVRKIGNEYFISLNKLDILPKISSVERIRRKFQEMGLYLPTKEETVIKRRMNIRIWKDTCKNGQFNV